ncbi:MAG: hypothetical protein H0T45_08240 [Pyrinomonadaceae bacterium]|nr:hypothetical protein [Pyrinomonadaceae bacterium]
MITGFNTDIEHDGVVYHVQTEDKGLATPFILSLVYVGGAILASKRAPYNDLVAGGFDADVLTERLHRQHKLICAAINSGRIDDLKRMSQREGDERPTTRAGSTPKAAPTPTPAPVAPLVSPPRLSLVVPPVSRPIPVPPAATVSAPPPVEVKPVKHVKTEKASPVAGGDVHLEQTRVALHLSLIEEKELYAGEVVTLRIRVSRGPNESRTPVANAAVTVKVLGSEFRPLVLTTKSDEDGVATVHAWLPRFKTGRAAVLIRAVASGYEAELRRLIHQV